MEPLSAFLQVLTWLLLTLAVLGVTEAVLYYLLYYYRARFFWGGLLVIAALVHGGVWALGLVVGGLTWCTGATHPASASTASSWRALRSGRVALMKSFPERGCR